LLRPTPQSALALLAFFFYLPSFSRHITVMQLGRKKDGASIIRVVPIWQMLASSQTTKQSSRRSNFLT